MQVCKAISYGHFPAQDKIQVSQQLVIMHYTPCEQMQNSHIAAVQVFQLSLMGGVQEIFLLMLDLLALYFYTNLQ